MKLRTIPQEYESIQFEGITEELEYFLKGTDSKVYMQGECFVLSGVIGNHGIDIGDYLYKTDSPLTKQIPIRKLAQAQTLSSSRFLQVHAHLHMTLFPVQKI